jgi:Rod binding domain-containing protein
MRPVAFTPAATDTQAATTPHRPAKPSEKALKAAGEFEAMMLRHMLESLQKTAHIGSSKSQSNSAYQSMAVDALADGIQRGGGLGLADLIARTLEAEISRGSR